MKKNAIGISQHSLLLAVFCFLRYVGELQSKLSEQTLSKADSSIYGRLDKTLFEL